jgi:pimeloyl-ACP methyl ester carboxylesterase
MRTVREVNYEIDGLSIAGRLWGQGGQAIIAIHGWLDNAASFDAIAQQLPDTQILALDLPGHGLSDHKPPSGNYAIWDDLRFITGVAQQMGWSKFALMGHSRGAMISSLLAGAFPEAVTHLICIDGLIPFPEDPANFPLQLAKYLQEFAETGSRESVEKGHVDFASALAARRAATPMVADAAKLIVARGSYIGSDGKTYWRSDRRLKLASPVKLSVQQLQANMDNICQPALLIMADKGFERWYPNLPVKLSKQFIVKRIAGEHHCHMEQQSVQVSGWIRAFLAGEELS